MVWAAKKTGVIAILGTQQRAGEHYHRAVDIVQSGRLGEVSQVECWNCLKIGKGWITPIIKDTPPDYLDWDRWLGSRARALYHQPAAT